MPDLFVISKTKATFGGAFSTTKLHWKKSKAALKSPVTVYQFFMNLGMYRIKQSSEILGLGAQTDDKGCSGMPPPPEQTSPFMDEAKELGRFNDIAASFTVIRSDRNGKSSRLPVLRLNSKEDHPLLQWAGVFDTRGNILGH